MARRAAWGVGLTITGLLAAAPGARAASLQVAYEHYVPGQGFQIGLVNAANGAPRNLPGA